MAWREAKLTIDGRTVYSFVDERCSQHPPCDRLPSLHWFGLFATRDQGFRFRFSYPDKGEALDEVEHNLMRLCERFGNGQAVCLQLLQTQWTREYYVYAGEGANLVAVLRS